MKHLTIIFIDDCKTLKGVKGQIMQAPENIALAAIRRGRAIIYDTKKAVAEQKARLEKTAEKVAQSEQKKSKKQSKTIE